MRGTLRYVLLGWAAVLAEAAWVPRGPLGALAPDLLLVLVLHAALLHPPRRALVEAVALGYLGDVLLGAGGGAHLFTYVAVTGVGVRVRDRFFLDHPLFLFLAGAIAVAGGTTLLALAVRLFNSTTDESSASALVAAASMIRGIPLTALIQGAWCALLIPPLRSRDRKAAEAHL